MSKIVFGFLIILHITFQGKGQSTKKDTGGLIARWEVATCKNIDSLILVKHNSEDSIFYRKILSAQRDFIVNQSKSGGLRADFIVKALEDSSFMFSECNDIFIVEHYRNGESFKAESYIYRMGDTSNMRMYLLQSGKWKLISVVNSVDKSIFHALLALKTHFCSAYYANESILVTQINSGVFTNKVLAFPCSDDFKMLKRVLKI